MCLLAIRQCVADLISEMERDSNLKRFRERAFRDAEVKKEYDALDLEGEQKWSNQYSQDPTAKEEYE